MKMTWRALARLLSLNVVALGAVLSVSGAGIPVAAGPSQETIQATGAALGEAYALEDSRIVAAKGADWAFATPAVSVAEHVIPVYLRRGVARNPIPPSIAGNAVLEQAAKYVGTPYVYGGTTPSGFDCTGFVSYVYAHFGVSLPRSSSAYYSIGTRVSATDARPGDLIVSSGHVAIYAGGSLQIDSPRPGKTIQFRSIWQSSYIFVRVL